MSPSNGSGLNPPRQPISLERAVTLGHRGRPKKGEEKGGNAILIKRSSTGRAYILARPPRPSPWASAPRMMATASEGVKPLRIAFSSYSPRTISARSITVTGMGAVHGTVPAISRNLLGPTSSAIAAHVSLSTSIPGRPSR